MRQLPTIRISGTPEAVLGALEIAKSITQKRKIEGWKLFQSDEKWNYEAKHDGRVCNICLSLAGRMVGTKIPIEFPDYKRWGKAHIKPGTHIYYPHLKWAVAPDAYGGCRCNLFWPDFLYVLLMRLDSELRETIIGAFEVAGFRRVP